MRRELFSRQILAALCVPCGRYRVRRCRIARQGPLPAFPSNPLRYIDRAGCLSLIASLTCSNFFGLGPRGRLKRVSTGLLEAAFGIGMVPSGAKWFAGLGEAASASVHHDGGGSSCRRAKSSAASFITTIPFKKNQCPTSKGEIPYLVA